METGIAHLRMVRAPHSSLDKEEFCENSGSIQHLLTIRLYKEAFSS